MPEAKIWSGFAPLFLDQGPRLCQPVLAATLRVLAQDGPRAFYQGPLTRRIVTGLREAGVTISEKDLAQTRTR